MSEDTEDFATLFEASTAATPLKTGQTIEGTIVAIGDGVAFVDVGAKGEATLALDELRLDDGSLEAGLGDRIQATVMATAGGVRLSRKLQRGAATRAQLGDAFRAGLPVEGRVERSVKGGFEVRIAGLRAFCPQSQIDLIRQTDPAAYDGRVFTFRIIEFKDDGRKFVVSRRVLLEEEQKARAAEVRQALAVGDVITGQVVSVRDFGAFVDIGGGVQGLLHVSEMGWSRVADTGSVATPGQEITVKVLRIDDGTGQIALGLKQLTTDPWDEVAAHYAPGQVVTARVTRVADFGAFVELEPGVEGLAHASTFPPGRPGAWARTVTTGATVPVEVLTIDVARKRIGVSFVHGDTTRAAKAAADAEEAADVRDYAAREETKNFSSLADKLRNAFTRTDE